MKRGILYICFLLGSLVSNTIFSQCCSPGNPIGGTSNLGIMDAQSLKVIFNYNFSRSGKYFDGSKPTDPYFVETGQFNNTNVDVAFALSKRFTIEFGLGYFINKTQNYIDGIIPESRKGYGFSNASTIGKINILQKNSWELTTGLGLMYPIGPYNKIFDRAIAELDIQPSSGAVNYVHTVFISKEFLEKHFRIFLFHRTEIKTANPLNYKYGNLYTSSIFASYSPSFRLDLVLQVRSEIRDKDERPGQTPPFAIEKVPVSGSKKLFFAPQVNYNLNQSLGIAITFDIPVYQYYNLQQLANTFAFSISLHKKIFLKDK